ncbi:MAG TPA: hypothetical protein VKQ71_08295 [Acidimicrobiales bacterium]|nr:hypothetical protein [Acidimicrobiales bacterium]
MTQRRGPLFWFSAAGGWTLIGWGLRGALHHHIDTRPPELARFVLGGALLHDLVFAPLVLGAGVVLTRIIPGRWQAPVQAGLLISGCAALLAWPEVRDYARVNHNPSSLPHNYTANLLIVVAAVCIGTALVTAVNRRGARRRAPVPTEPDGGS